MPPPSPQDRPARFTSLRGRASEMSVHWGGRGKGHSSRNLKSALPAWIIPGAMFDADFANGLYFFNGVAYPDETTFLAAIGGSKAGNIRTIGPYDIPGTPNLLT